MNDAPLQNAYAELRTLLGQPTVPEGVQSTCLRLSKVQTKLFCTVQEPLRASDGAAPVHNAGTLNGDGYGLRLEPSNFLCELLAAIRASEWPRVIVLVHHALDSDQVNLRHNTGPPKELAT